MNAPNPYLPQAMSSGFGGGHEVASTAAAATAKALAEARYVMALHRPRDMDQARQDLLRECRRPAFARNKSTLYHKPVGAGVEGLGIRFVEAAIRCIRNIDVGAELRYEDERKEVYRVAVVDLETNVPYNLDVPVSKLVERAKPLDDGTYVSVRRNSQGRAVYTVPASDDDMLNKRNALISKAVRTLGLRLVPGDLQDECEETIKAVRIDEAAKDPDRERHAMADAFASLGVRVDELREYLGHDLGTCDPAELVQLRGLYGAIREGEASWRAAIESVREARAKAAAPAAATGPAAPPPPTGAGRLKERIKKSTAPTPPPASAKGQDGPPGPAQDPSLGQESAEQLRAAVMAAPDEDAAYLVVDRARHLGREDYDQLVALVESRFQQGDA